MTLVGSVNHVATFLISLLDCCDYESILKILKG